MTKAKTQDFTKAFTDMFAQFPGDMSAFNDAYKNNVALAEKMSKVALTAAEQSAEISNKWTKDAIAKLGTVTKAKDEPADYSKALTDFASASVEVAAENMAAFAEVAKTVQMETVELMLASGKQAQAEATAAVQKATTEATAAVKKAAKAA